MHMQVILLDHNRKRRKKKNKKGKKGPMEYLYLPIRAKTCFFLT